MKNLLAAINAKYIHSNLAVYSLRAYAQKHGQETQIAEYTVNQTLDGILMDLYRQQPDLLCFSCYLWNISYVEQLIREIPKVMPRTKIWLGGPEVSYNAVDMLEEYPAISGVMRGEGEETFLELLEYYHREENGGAGGGLLDIPGITYREKDGSIRETASRPALDLSTVPFPYKEIGDFRNRIVYYESGRGCPFSCSYCLSSIDKCLRFRDIELVKEELQFFIDHEVPQVKFVDRTFNCRHDHAMAVWSYLKEHDRGITNFHFEIAADLLNEEEMELIRSMRPGLIQLEIGVQSANSSTIREIRRVMDLERVEQVTAEIREAGNVHQHLDLIAGLPFEDYRSFSESFNRVYAMKPQQLQLGFLKVLKGSLMHEKTEEYGLLYQERPPYEVLSTKWLSYSDLIRLKQIEEMTEVYYNSGQFHNTMEHAREAFPDAFSMYEALARYYDSRGLFQVSHTRIARYEILKDFLGEYLSEEQMDEYVQWLTLDLYLRDNVKNRPGFLGESRVSPDEAAAFYKREEAERRYLRGYEGYDRRQMRKMTHLERIGGTLCLFDYRKRDPLTGNAAVYEITEHNVRKDV
ncbi:MAG TPA: B12-binding domain-containing radical SAM protein [Candidatus Mediterraneibacter colneyensis]|nr:B12-binding domain-containing radical SAM protein [Candidatus Mediterraneibacter colneyensis]